MGKIGRAFALFLTLIIAIPCLTLLIVNPAGAQTIPVPAIPQFTVKFIPAFINTTITDPYTGANTATTQNLSTIELTITNQQYTYSNGSTFNIYYDIRVKGHFENSWNELYPTTELLPAWENYYTPNNYQSYEVPYIWAQGMVDSLQFLPQSNSAYTNVSLPADKYPSNGQVDIQVEAMLGVNSTYYLPSNAYAYGVGGNTYPATAYVTSSSWSNTQTINLADGSISISTSPNSTPTPTIPELSWLVIVTLFLSFFSVALVFRHQKTVQLE